MERDARLVLVDSRKYDGSPHRSYRAVLLGRDEHGTWLGVGGEELAAGNFKHPEPFVLLVPEHAWWTAMFNPPPRRTEVYCDVTTPATWAQGRMSVVDLDLDVRRRRGTGAVEIVDNDEFELHSERYGYPAEVVGAARTAATWLESALTGGAEPFATGYKVWLDRVTGGPAGGA